MTPSNWGDINHLSELWCLHCLTIINNGLLSRGSVEWLRSLGSDMTTVELYGSSASGGMTAPILQWSIKPVTKGSAKYSFSITASFCFLFLFFPLIPRCSAPVVLLPFPFHLFCNSSSVEMHHYTSIKKPFFFLHLQFHFNFFFFYNFLLTSDSFPALSTRVSLPWSSAAKASASTSSRGWPGLLASPMTFT